MSLTSFIFIKNCTASDTARDKNLKIPADIRVFRDIPYDIRGHLLDVSVPNNIYSSSEEKPIPIIISIHGGGYVYGNKEVYQYYAANLAENGFVVVNFNYRLAPKSKFPAPLEDTNNVLKWLVKNADTYKADLNNVFIVGDSAGAQIASQFGVIYSNPTYASLFDFQIPEEIKLRGLGLNCGRYSLKTDDNRPDKNGLMREYLGRNVVNGDPRLDILENVTKDYPASFIMSAVHDFLLPEAKPMYELMKTKKVKAVYKVYGSDEQTYMSHVFHCNLNLKEASECNREECEFFKRLMVS